MKKSKLIFCVIILLISLVALSIWQVPKILDKDNNGENNVENNSDVKYVKLDMEKYNSLPTPVTIRTSKDIKGKSVERDISPDLKEQLSKYIIFETATNDGYISDVYRNKKTTVNDLSKNEILLTALRNTVDCKYDEYGIELESYDYWVKFSDLKAKAIELYGFDVIGDERPFYFRESAYGDWMYSEGEDAYRPGAGGPLSCFSQVTLDVPIVDIRKDGDYIYIYTEVYFYGEGLGYDAVFANYEDYINGVPFADLLTDEGNYEFEGEDEYSNRFDYLKAKYPKIIHTYEHTFEKKPDGGYHWVSSEPLTK